MEFKHSCFISYRHHKGEFSTTFIDNLEDALSDYLETYLDERKPFVDKTGISGGEYLEETITSAIRDSVCMVLVFTPTFFCPEHTYCTREYLYMTKIEQLRHRYLGMDKTKSHIIPIALRAPAELVRIMDHRRTKFHDFSRYTLADCEIKSNAKYCDYIEDIAQYIYGLFREMENVKCNGTLKKVKFPSQKEALTWLKTRRPKSEDFPYRNMGEC